MIDSIYYNTFYTWYREDSTEEEVLKSVVGAGFIESLEALEEIDDHDPDISEVLYLIPQRDYEIKYAVALVYATIMKMSKVTPLKLHKVDIPFYKSTCMNPDDYDFPDNEEIIAMKERFKNWFALGRLEFNKLVKYVGEHFPNLENHLDPYSDFRKELLEAGRKFHDEFMKIAITGDMYISSDDFDRLQQVEKDRETEIQKKIGEWILSNITNEIGATELENAAIYMGSFIWCGAYEGRI